MQDLTHGALVDFANMFVGEKIADGSARDVFKYIPDPTKVVKVEVRGKSFQNISEWQFWEDFKNKKSVAKWLAPCHAISACGIFLIQEYARDLIPSEHPKRLPEFITDHKIENLGVIDDRLVCRDYGYVNADVEVNLRKWREYEKKMPFRE